MNSGAGIDNGGFGHVAAFLAELDISDFDPKAPPPKTPAFWDIVDASRAPEDAELADVLDALERPAVLTLPRLVKKAEGAVAEWLTERKNLRAIPHRLERNGYVSVRNPDATSDGRWKIERRRQTVYARRELSLPEQIAAARKLTNGP